jgi:hypothetical protein
MLNGAEIVASYEVIWEITQLMAAAAKKNEWDELATLEKKRFALMKELMAADGRDLSDARLNAKKSELIRSILDSDAETKKLTEAWMVELRQILDSIGAEKKLNDAYAGHM